MKTTCCPAYTIKYVLDIVLNIWLLNSIEDDRLDGLIGNIHAHLIICTWNLRTRSIKLLLSELSIQPSSVLGHCLVTFSGTGFNSWGRQLMLSAILYQGTTRRVFLWNTNKSFPHSTSVHICSTCSIRARLGEHFCTYICCSFATLTLIPRHSLECGLGLLRHYQVKVLRVRLWSSLSKFLSPQYRLFLWSFHTSHVPCAFQQHRDFKNKLM